MLLQNKGGINIKTIIISAITALVVSAIYNKFSAAYTIEVIDGYVKDMIEEVVAMIKEVIRDIHSNK